MQDIVRIGNEFKLFQTEVSDAEIVAFAACLQYNASQQITVGD